MAALGKYYAAKIRGAVALYRFETSGDAADHARARKHLLAASNHWKQYAAQWSSQYVKQVLTRSRSLATEMVLVFRDFTTSLPRIRMRA